MRRLVNRVSVEASFFKRMSAIENLSYAARFYGLTPSVTRGRIPEILERVGFPVSRSTEPMEDLSRGMQQKVALARALLTSPVLLLLDEPTTGLDPRSKREVQSFIERFASRRMTRRSCSARTTSPRPRRWPSGSGSCMRGDCWRSSRLQSWSRATAPRTLEDAFFTATGAALEEDEEVEIA